MVLDIVEYPIHPTSNNTSLDANLALRRFLIEHGLWDKRYVAFSVPLNGDVDASDLEKRLAELGKVNCDVLGTGDLNYCKRDPRNPNSDGDNAFLKGKIAIGIYDTSKLQQNGSWSFKRPQVNPSEYVAMVIVPKAQQPVA